MPTVTVCLWNIQNYGSGNPRRKFGTNSKLRNRFIRDFVEEKQIDILMIMEVSQHAGPSLQNLVNRLNENKGANVHKDWAMSFCGSAITANGNNPIQGAADVTFSTDARSEGYGVLWRTNRASFTVLSSLVNMAVQTWVPGVNPNPPATTPLNFTTEGREADTVVLDYGGLVPGTRKRKARVEEFRAVGGYTTDELYPYDEDGNVMAYWPDLKMPTTSTRNPRNLSWDRARRPAYIVVDLNINGGTSDERLCPVVAYHAPSNQRQASWGAYMSGLSRELYVTNDLDVHGDPDPNTLVHNDNVIMGGDYNYSVDQASWPDDYKYYTADFDEDHDGGAECDEIPPNTNPDVDRRTTVQLLEGQQHNQVINGGVSTDYFRHKIDLAFLRSSAGTTMTGVRPNVVLELRNDNAGAIYGATLQAFRAHLNGIVAAVAGPNQRFTKPNGVGPEERIWDANARQYVWKPMIAGSWGGSFTNWTNFMTMLNNGQLTTARRAAEFYHIFVSDHLPLVVDIDF